jgi:hypothetical protein
MAIFYIDLYNGNDANNGSTWALAWKTITNGATAARIAPGDEIRISKTPDPVSIGNASWADNTNACGVFPATKAVTATANNGSGLIRVTTATHGFTTGDIVQIVGLVGTYEANGAWKINVIDTTKFDLVDSAYINARTSGGTAQKINSKAVVLATAGLTKDIDTCKFNWSNGVDGTATLITTDHKHGGACVKITLDSTAQANQKQGYHATGLLDLSGYQKISFWIKNSAAIANATTYTITLCSDIAGATPVDTFVIPAIPSTSRWIPLTIARTGGGNLGSSIQSIAINSGATAPTNSSNIQIDNFIACTTEGLAMDSLISKNGAAQGGTEGFYSIQSIKGKVVLLDNDPNTLSNAGRGYSGTTETVASYIRSSFKTALAASPTTTVQAINDSGTVGNNISWQFGYEIGTTNQNGETFFDGLNGNGHGLYLTSKSYNTFNCCSFSRYYNGIFFTSNADNNTITTISNANNNVNAGIYIGSCNNTTITTISNANNNNNSGISIALSHNTTITTISNVNNNNIGILFSNSNSTTITTISNANNNANNAIYFSTSSMNTIKSLSTTGNIAGSIYNDTGVNFIKNATLAEISQVVGMMLGAKPELYSIKEDGVVGNNWVYFYGATANWQTGTKHDTEQGAWKLAITSSNVNSRYMNKLKLAEFAYNSGALVTVTAWVKKDHATNIVARLCIYADVVQGIATDITQTKASDTNWEQLSITFTPSEAGVTELFLESWYVTGNSNNYVGTITISQA